MQNAECRMQNASSICFSSKRNAAKANNDLAVGTTELAYIETFGNKYIVEKM